MAENNSRSQSESDNESDKEPSNSVSSQSKRDAPPYQQIPQNRRTRAETGKPRGDRSTRKIQLVKEDKTVSRKGKPPQAPTSGSNKQQGQAVTSKTATKRQTKMKKGHGKKEPPKSSPDLHKHFPTEPTCAKKQTYRKCEACTRLGLTIQTERVPDMESADVEPLEDSSFAETTSTDERVVHQKMYTSRDLKGNRHTSSEDTSRDLSFHRLKKRKHKIAELSESHESSPNVSDSNAPVSKLKKKIHTPKTLSKSNLIYSDDNNDDTSSSLDSFDKSSFGRANVSPATPSVGMDSSVEEAKPRRSKKIKKHCAENQKNGKGTSSDTTSPSEIQVCDTEFADGETSNTGIKKVMKHFRNFQNYIKASFKKIKRPKLFILKRENPTDSSDNGYKADGESAASDAEKISKVKIQKLSEAQCTPSERAQDEVKDFSAELIRSDDEKSLKKLDREEEADTADPFENIDLSRIFEIALNSISRSIERSVEGIVLDMWESILEVAEEN